MESTVTCITWTNEFPKGVDAIRVSYPLIFFCFYFIIYLFLWRAWQKLTVLMTITWGTFLLLACFLFCFFYSAVHTSLSMHIRAVHTPTPFDPQPGGCVCVCSAATNEDFYSGHSAQCVLSPQCDCAVNWPSPCWRCVRFTPTLFYADFWRRQSVRVHTSGYGWLRLSPAQPG